MMVMARWLKEQLWQWRAIAATALYYRAGTKNINLCKRRSVILKLFVLLNIMHPVASME